MSKGVDPGEGDEVLGAGDDVTSNGEGDEVAGPEEGNPEDGAERLGDIPKGEEEPGAPENPGGVEKEVEGVAASAPSAVASVSSGFCSPNQPICFI